MNDIKKSRIEDHRLLKNANLKGSNRPTKALEALVSVWDISGHRPISPKTTIHKAPDAVNYYYHVANLRSTIANLKYSSTISTCLQNSLSKATSSVFVNNAKLNNTFVELRDAVDSNVIFVNTFLSSFRKELYKVQMEHRRVSEQLKTLTKWAQKKARISKNEKTG